MTAAIRAESLLPGLTTWYLGLMGIWRMINSFRAERRVTAYFRLQWALTLLLALPFLFCQFLCPAFIRIDLEKATLITLNSVSCFQMIFKPGVFWLNIDRHGVLFDLMTKDLLASVPAHKKQEADRIYRGLVRRCNLFCHLVLVVTFTGVSIWAANPGIRSEYIANHVGNMRAVTTGPVKIFAGWYPVPFTRSPWAQVAYVYELILIYWCAVMVTIYEVIVTQQVMALHAHFSVLNYHLSTLRKEEVLLYSGRQGITNGEVERLLYAEFIAIIKDHQQLLRYGKLLQASYNSYITNLLSTGGLILIISIFQFFFGAKDPLMSLKFMLYLFFQMTEFTLICFTTTMLETSSTNMEFSMYSSEWYSSRKKLRNAAQMVMLRSQKPASLLAVRMYPVNVETLMNIFQLTYSVSAFLARMVE